MKIKYFGASVVYGPDCERLDSGRQVRAQMSGGGSVVVSAGALAGLGQNRTNYPKSYTVQGAS